MKFSVKKRSKFESKGKTLDCQTQDDQRAAPFVPQGTREMVRNHLG